MRARPWLRLSAIVPITAAALVGTWLAMLFLSATPEKAAEMLSDGWPVLGLLVLLYVGGSVFVVRSTGRWQVVDIVAATLVPLAGVLAWTALAFRITHVPVSTLPAVGIAVLSGLGAAAVSLGSGLVHRTGRSGRGPSALVVAVVAAGLCAAGIAIASALLLELPQMVPDLSTGIVLPTATHAEWLANSRAAASDPYMGVLALGGFLTVSAGALALLTNRLQFAPDRPLAAGQHSAA